MSLIATPVGQASAQPSHGSMCGKYLQGRGVTGEWIACALLECTRTQARQARTHTRTQAEKKGWGCEPCLCMQTAINHSSCQGQKRAMIQSLEPDPWWTRPLTDLVCSPLTNHVLLSEKSQVPALKIQILINDRCRSRRLNRTLVLLTCSYGSSLACSPSEKVPPGFFGAGDARFTPPLDSILRR